MKKRTWIISFLALATVFVALLTWYVLENYKRVSQERNLPSQGEARYNPLYALKLSLLAMGQKVDARARLSTDTFDLKANDTLLFYAPPNALSEAQIDNLLKWVGSGGHLILKSPNKSMLTNEISLFRKLGITAGESDDECLQYLAVNEIKPEYLCGDLFFVEDVEWFSWLHGNKDRGFTLGKMNWGDGNITIVSTLRFMNNEGLQNNGARQLAYQLLAESINKGRFYLVYATDMSPLWLLLLKYGWMLIAPLFVLLVAWLFYRSQRFGPLQASPSQDRRALLEHISATGEYMFHRQLGHELHLAVLSMFNVRLFRRDPITAALSGEAQIQALAERTGIDSQRIRQALKPGSLRQKENFFNSVATLIQLRNQL